MSFFAILLLLLVAFIVWPVIKLGYKIYRVKRQFDDMQRRAAAAGAPYGGNRGDDTSYAQTPQRKRRIDPSIATYIEYEELSVDVQSEIARQYRYREVQYVRQQQIQDIEWEEIP